MSAPAWLCCTAGARSANASWGSPSTLTRESFRRLDRDVHVPAGSTGSWQGALRDSEGPLQDQLRAAIGAGDGMTIEALCKDHEGGQRTISRCGPTAREGSEHLTSAARHWSLERPAPR
jgi:hypothetical protein